MRVRNANQIIKIIAKELDTTDTPRRSFLKKMGYADNSFASWLKDRCMPRTGTMLDMLDYLGFEVHILRKKKSKFETKEEKILEEA